MRAHPRFQVGSFLRWTLAAMASALALGGVLALAQPAPKLTFHEVLAVGDPAPGFPAGAVIEAIGDTPRIDAEGHVSVIVTVRDPTAGALQSLYRQVAGSPERVFKAGDPAPGTAGDFELFPDLPQTPRIQGGRLTFAGSVGDPDVVNRAGIWSDRSGSFELLVLSGDHLPGLPADAEIADFGFSTRGETVLLRGRYVSGGAAPPENKGLWRNSGGAWEAVLVNRMPAPGLPGAVFGGDPSRVYGPLFAYDAGDGGRVLAQAWVNGPRIDKNNDEALWIETGGVLRILAREGDKPDRKATFGPTSSSPTFGADNENLVPTVNGRGAALFGAVLRNGKTRLNSVWTNRSGALTLVARGSLPLSGFGQGDQAPGLPPGATFGTFEQGAINESNRIAFQGFADEFDTMSNLTRGIWWDVPGKLTLIAAEGRPVPGAPGAVYFDVTLESLTDDGSLFFLARLAGSGVNASNDQALLRARPDGSVGIVLREGDAVEVVETSGTSAVRVVRSFQVGRELSADGRAAAQLTFTDGSSGVYTASL